MEPDRLHLLAQLLEARREATRAGLRAAQARVGDLRAGLDALAARHRAWQAATDPGQRAAGDAAWARLSGRERARLNTELAAALAAAGSARDAAVRAFGQAEAARRLADAARAERAARRAAASAVLAENVEEQDILDRRAEDLPRRFP